MTAPPPTNREGGPGNLIADYQPSPEEKARLEAERAKREKLGAAIDLLLEAYLSGELTLERFGAYCMCVVQKLPTVGMRERWLGEVFYRALQVKPPEKRRKVHPANLRQLARDLVPRIVKQEGLKRNRASADIRGEDTAYKRASRVLSEVGLDLPAHQIEPRKKPRKIVRRNSKKRGRK